MRLVSKNGNQWLIERGVGSPGLSTPQTPTRLEFDCLARDDGFSFQPSWTWAWDFVNDPHGPAVLWSGSVAVDIDSLLATHNPPITGQATKILLSLDNTLNATSETGTAALIKKKEFNGASIIVDTNVPEPTSLALLAAGAVFVGSRRRS